MRPEAALETVLALSLTAWTAWWLVTLAVALVDRRTAARFAPPVLRAILIGGAVLATTAPAHARGGIESLDGLALPERPVTPDRTPPDVRAPEAATHVVRPGECLWSIVRDHSPALEDSDVSAEVTRWHRANRDVIGPDADLIQPGQRLDPPGEAR